VRDRAHAKVEAKEEGGGEHRDKRHAPAPEGTEAAGAAAVGAAAGTAAAGPKSPRSSRGAAAVEERPGARPPDGQAWRFALEKSLAGETGDTAQHAAAVQRRVAAAHPDKPCPHCTGAGATGRPGRKPAGASENLAPLCEHISLPDAALPIWGPHSVGPESYRSPRHRHVL